MGELRKDLKRDAVELEETHISWVFLTDRDVWKVKKPVSLGFLDFSTTEKRRAACEAEVILNRRLAPDVYLNVVPITLDAACRHQIGGDRLRPSDSGGGESAGFNRPKNRPNRHKNRHKNRHTSLLRS